MSILFVMLIYGMAIIISLVFLVFWIWALVDCLRRPEESYEKMFGTISPKLVWALIIFFGHLIGAIIYFFVAGTRKSPRQTVVAADSAGTDEGKRILQMIADCKISSEEGRRLLMALGKKETEKAKSQTTATPKPLKVGCLIFVVALPIIFIFLLWFLMTFSHVSTTGTKTTVCFPAQVQKIQEQSNELIKAGRGLENIKK